jgi:hypothetical protein
MVPPLLSAATLFVAVLSGADNPGQLGIWLELVDMVLLLVAILSLSVASTAAPGTNADKTPPSAPRVDYA